MKRQTRNLMMLAGVGALFWYWIRRGQMPIQAEQMYASRETIRPTDSMLTGTMPMAVAGIVKEDGQLKCIGCV